MLSGLFFRQAARTDSTKAERVVPVRPFMSFSVPSVAYLYARRPSPSTTTGTAIPRIASFRPNLRGNATVRIQAAPNQQQESYSASTAKKHWTPRTQTQLKPEVCLAVSAIATLVALQ